MEERERYLINVVQEPAQHSNARQEFETPHSPPPAFSTWNRNLEFQKKEVENRSPETWRGRGALSDNPAKKHSTQKKEEQHALEQARMTTKKQVLYFAIRGNKKKPSEDRSSLLAENKTA
jgi:hypothetical protein